jgi:hypothetical protein
MAAARVQRSTAIVMVKMSGGHGVSRRKGEADAGGR